MFKQFKAMNKFHRFFLFFLSMLFLLIGCEKKEYSDWTILIYMAADNGLNDAAISDIEEMQLAEFSDKIKVIVQIDYSENHPDYHGARRFLILPGEEPKYIDSLGEINSGDYNQITRFANWGFDEYPSNRNALIIWSHGNSWYSHPTTPAKFCPDQESGDFINITEGELKSAFQNINTNLDVTILDACNMMSIEVLAEIYKYSDYVIGSEEEVNTDGFPYGDNVGTGLLSIWEDYESTEILASVIVDSYMDSYFPGGSQYNTDEFPLSCSAYKSSEFSGLINLLSDFVEFPADSTEIAISRENCIEFNDLDSDVDIKDFFAELAELTENDELITKCEDIFSAIDECFINQRYFDYLSGNIGTASVWFPQNQEIFNNLRSYYNNLEFNNATNWDTFLERIFE